MGPGFATQSLSTQFRRQRGCQDANLLNETHIPVLRQELCGWLSQEVLSSEKHAVDGGTMVLAQGMQPPLQFPLQFACLFR